MIPFGGNATKLDDRAARCRGAGLVVALVVICAAGCGGAPRSIVRGRVSLEGKPLAHGTIAFLPVDGKGPTAGAIVKDGRYEVRGVMPGRKLVRVEGFAAEAAFPVTTADLADQAATRPRRRSEPVAEAELVAADAVGNNAERQVAAGEQVIDVAIGGR